jgi:hypothetical protein
MLRQNFRFVDSNIDAAMSPLQSPFGQRTVERGIPLVIQREAEQSLIRLIRRELGFMLASLRYL